MKQHTWIQYFLLLHLIVIANSLKAQQSVDSTFLCLQSANLPNKIVRVYAPLDLLSQRDSVYAQVSTQADTLSCMPMHISKIQQMRMRVGTQSVEWFAVPKKQYRWQLFDLGTADSLVRHPLRVRLLTQDVFNMAIDGFAYAYQSFLDNNFVELMRQHDRGVYNQFEQEMLQKLDETVLTDSLEAQFLRDYVSYHLAQLRWTAQLESKQSLINSMFKNKPLRLNNPAYISLLQALFDPNNMDRVEVAKKYDMIAMLRAQDNVQHLKAAIEARYALSHDNPLIDMILLNSIKSLHALKILDTAYLKHLLQTMAQQSEYVYIRLTANNLSKTLWRYRKGAAMPSWDSLPMLQASAQPRDGKPVYMMFYTPYCHGCNTDLKALQSIQKEAKVHVVCVFVDMWKAKHQGQQIAAQYPQLEWRWFGDNYQWLTNFGIQRCPAVYLIDEQNKLISPAPPRPHAQLSDYLRQQLKK